MIDKEYLKYCKVNEASKGIFPTYFLLDLELTEKQRESLSKLIEFLDDVRLRYTPPTPKICSSCGRGELISYADTWGFSEHLQIKKDLDILKKLLEPTRWMGDHT